jgi:hypothetical protein
LPLDKELSVRTTWIILGDKTEIDLDKMNLTGGYRFEYSEEREKIIFKKKGTGMEFHPAENLINNNFCMQMAKAPKVLNGGGQFVTYSKINDGEKHRLVPVQQQITIDDGKKLHIYYGICTIASFHQKK